MRPNLHVHRVAIAAALFSASVLRAAELDVPSLRAISAASLRRTIEAAAPDRGSRLTGYPLCRETGRRIRHILRTECGFQKIIVDQYTVTVPEERFQTRLEVLGPDGKTRQTFRVHPLWPNNVRTCTVGEEPLEGRLVNAGVGAPGAYNNLDLGRSPVVALMDFESDDAWLVGASLGVRAFVFTESATASFNQAREKYLRTPIDVPRFYATPEVASALKDLVTKQPELPIRIACRVDWVDRPAQNIMAVVPGSDPDLADQNVVIQCYYDSWSVVPTLAPGAEAACGLATWLEMARYLAKHPPARTVCLLATPGHFLCQRGITEFLLLCGRRTTDPRQVETEHPIDPEIVFCLDLTSQTRDVGVWHCTWDDQFRRYFSPYGHQFEGLAAKATAALGWRETHYVNGISPKVGKGWWAFMPVDLRVDGEVCLAAAVPALALATVHDARTRAGTPLDWVRHVNYENLRVQTQLLVGTLALFVNVPTLQPRSKMKVTDKLAALQARAVTFIQRKSVTPDEAISGAVGIVRYEQEKNLQGMVRDQIDLADRDGYFQVRNLRIGGAPFLLEAYGLDADTGQIRYAPDRGTTGDKALPMQIRMNVRYKDRSVVLFRCYATNVFNMVDPLYLTNLTQISLFNEVDTTPDSYGYCLGTPTPYIAKGNTESCGVVFGELGRQWKLAMGSGVLGYRFLLLGTRGLKEGEDKGVGFDSETTPSVWRTGLQVARDMYNLDESRMRELRRHRIANERLERLHTDAKAVLDLAEQAAREHQWSDHVRLTQSALGIESRAYPDVRSTQNDVIRGILFYLALLIPASFFLERLLFGFPTIGKQISGTVGVFLVVFFMLAWLHPAFQLSSPFVILVAFVMMALSLVVIAVLRSRFEAQMQRQRNLSSMVHETDVARTHVTMTAFMLGIGNMKRRKMRTAMTMVSVMLMTFAVLSFSSVKTSLQTLSRARSYRAPYEGILIRSKRWKPLERSTYNYLVRNFQHKATVCPRAWYRARVANVSFLVSGPGGGAHVRGVVGMTPQEVLAQGSRHPAEPTHGSATQAEYPTPPKWVVAGRWLQDEETDACLLPDKVADLAGVTAEQVRAGKARVQLFGESLRVVGILDSNRLRECRDLDEEPLSPADFSQFASREKMMDREESREKQVVTESAVVVETLQHHPVDTVVVLPYQRLMDLGGDIYSVAVHFDRRGVVRGEVDKLLRKLAMIVFVGMDGQVLVMSSLGLSSVSGLGGLLVPMLLVGLILLNTMVGSVYDRQREIAIYSSVGMAPRHIGFLFMAESLVYAVLGVCGGYFLGQLVVKIFTPLGWLSGMTLNYSSMSAVGSALVVMLVVVLSAAYPAAKASRIAVPDIEKQMKLPEPEGDRWQFEFPFTVPAQEALGLWAFLREFFQNYSEESVGTFYARDVRLELSDPTPGGEHYQLTMDVWLSPYDLGVSQHLVFEARPEKHYGEAIYEAYLDIERTSGEVSAWKRVNKRLITEIRKQFLIWRVVAPQSKQEFHQRGLNLLAGLPPEAGPVDARLTGDAAGNDRADPPAAGT